GGEQRPGGAGRYAGRHRGNQSRAAGIPQKRFGDGRHDADPRGRPAGSRAAELWPRSGIDVGGLGRAGARRQSVGGVAEYRPARAPALMREARDTIEQLKETELKDYFRDSCVATFPGRQQSIDRVAPGAAVLYPISLPDRVELLVSIGQEQRQFTIPVTETAL